MEKKFAVYMFNKIIGAKVFDSFRQVVIITVEIILNKNYLFIHGTHFQVESEEEFPKDKI
ncbi:unnamed protein product [Debaryomyces fabryi]|nr:unnamed protein product [Debaryomyces fabryi]